MAKEIEINKIDYHGKLMLIAAIYRIVTNKHQIWTSLHSKHVCAQRELYFWQLHWESQSCS